MNDIKFLFQNSVSKASILPYDGEAYYYPNFLNPCPQLEELKANFNFEHLSFMLYGKEVFMPRLVAYQGDKSYSYSNITHEACPMTDAMNAIISQLQDIESFNYNVVLANLYRDGNDSMSLHSDNEAEIDHSIIASLSFGAKRMFHFKHRKTKKLIKVELEDNSLLLMKHCQDHWLHGIPKTKQGKGERLNLTFRRIK